MTEASLGKKFETVFRENWKKSFPGSFVYRLPDQMSGFQQTSANPCDFICFTEGKLYLVECKEHKGMSIPFSAIRQYEKLLSFKGLKDVYPGVTVWFSEKGTVIWVGIEEMEKIVLDGKKSISLKMLEEKQYNIIEIPEMPSLRRKFPNSDYSVLIKGD